MVWLLVEALPGRGGRVRALGLRVGPGQIIPRTEGLGGIDGFHFRTREERCGSSEKREFLIGYARHLE